MDLSVECIIGYIKQSIEILMNMKLEENGDNERKGNPKSMRDHVRAFRDADYTHDVTVYEKQIQKFE